MSSVKNHLSAVLLASVAVLLLLAGGVSATIMSDSNTAWQVVHEEAEDKTTTSTAYVDTAKGDRFSLTINAVKRQKVCALLLSSPPPVVAKEFQGKMVIDGQVVWQGKLLTIPDPFADLFFLDLGFDWTIPLEGLRKGNSLIVEYWVESGDPVITKFVLKGSSNAIGSMLDMQSKLAEEAGGSSVEKNP